MGINARFFRLRKLSNVSKGKCDLKHVMDGQTDGKSMSLSTFPTSTFLTILLLINHRQKGSGWEKKYKIKSGKTNHKPG